MIAVRTCPSVTIRRDPHCDGTLSPGPSRRSRTRPADMALGNHGRNRTAARCRRRERTERSRRGSTRRGSPASGHPVIMVDVRLLCILGCVRTEGQPAGAADPAHPRAKQTSRGRCPEQTSRGKSQGAVGRSGEPGRPPGHVGQRHRHLGSTVGDGSSASRPTQKPQPSPPGDQRRERSTLKTRDREGPETGTGQG
jgi:hypothetical protein